MSTAKQFFLLKFSSEFVSNQKCNKSNVKRFDKFDKIKIYNIDENVENEFKKDFFNQNDVDVDDNYADDYHASKNIFYYQFFSYNEFEDENDNAVYLITSKVLLFESNKLVICKKCDDDFTFNNKLHEHFRFDCFNKIDSIYFVVIDKLSFIIMITQNSKFTVNTRNSIKKLSIINSFSITFDKFTSSFITSFRFTIILSNTSKLFSAQHFDFFEKLKSTFVFIIVFDVDFSKNVDIDHDFRNWNYARIHVFLFFTTDVEFVCLIIDAEIIFCDRQFFKKQASNVFIKIMITFISIRDLDVDKHMTIEYIILFMYFFDQKNDVTIKIKIIREIHLLDNLKINMLLNNDVIESKKIDVNVSNKSTYIDNCEIIDNFEIRTSRSIVQISIHERKITIVFSHNELILSMHYIIVSFDRNYLFESNEFNFSFYVYLINFTFKHIVVRNKNSQTVHISWNCRVDHMIEIDFINAFQIHVDEISEIVDLTFRRSTRTHKTNWFKKIIVATYVVINMIASIAELTLVIVVSISKTFHNFTLS